MQYLCYFDNDFNYGETAIILRHDLYFPGS